MKNIAIIGGGNSSEAEIAIKSAGQLIGMMDATKYNLYLVSIIADDWHVEYKDNKYPIDKADFSFNVDNTKITFDCAYITIHGTPGEDGRLPSYFELINMPYTSCGVFESALTFNKFACKCFLDKYDILSAKAVLLRKGDTIDADEIISKTGLPCFIKPNNGGSSFGVSKVKTKEEIVPAVEHALKEDSEIIIEEFIEGTEITNGVYRANGKITVLPITEIVSENDFFDYEAKYTGKSNEITPARLEKNIEENCKQLTAEIYDHLNCTGIVRVDYIIKGEKLYMLEINTVPGLSSASIIPQQIRAAGLKTEDVFSEIIEDSINRHK